MGNSYNGTTIGLLLEQYKENLGTALKEINYNRGGRGKKEMVKTKVSTTGRALKVDSEYEKREKFRRRAAIELVIGHLKAQYRIQQNYLNGKDSAQTNAFLGYICLALEEIDEKIKKETIFLYVFLKKQFEKSIFNLISPSLKAS